MNTILFESHEVNGETLTLPGSDSRAVHIREILRARVGDTLRVGEINGPRGIATLQALQRNSCTLALSWQEEPPTLYPVHLLVGLPRPPTARKILTQCTTQGVCAMHFYQSALGEKSYAQSPLWLAGEWRLRVIEGASQANSTRLPLVEQHSWLRLAVQTMLAQAGSHALRLMLDHAEEAQPMASLLKAGLPEGRGVCLAIGPERGWTDSERLMLKESGFLPASLGVRTLRVETAAVAAVAITLALSAL